MKKVEFYRMLLNQIPQSKVQSNQVLIENGFAQRFQKHVGEWFSFSPGIKPGFFFEEPFQLISMVVPPLSSKYRAIMILRNETGLEKIVYPSFIMDNLGSIFLIGR